MKRKFERLNTVTLLILVTLISVFGAQTSTTNSVQQGFMSNDVTVSNAEEMIESNQDLAIPYYRPRPELSATPTSITFIQTTVYIDPATIEVNVCDNFTININVANVTNLYAYEFKLTWNTSLINCITCTPTPPWGLYVVAKNECNDTVGYYWLAATALTPAPSFTGSTTLAQCEFHCKGAGECVLDLQNTRLLNPNANLVPTPPNLGDANGDLKVDIKDGVLVVKAYGSMLGQPQYNPNTDFNNDTFVDLMDLLIWALNYGRMYPGNASLPVNNTIAHAVIDGYVKQNSPPPVHDIAIIDLSSSETVVLQGHNVTIYVTLQNQGDSTETFTLWTFCGFHGNITLSEGASTIVNYTFNTSKLPVGNYTLWAYVLPCFGDQDPYDNIYVDGVLEVAAAIHDVAVTDVTSTTPGKTRVGQNLSFKIDATIQNQGNYSETFNVTCYAGNITVGKQQLTMNLGNTTTIMFIWNTTGVAKGNYTLKAVADTVSGEVDVLDNTFFDSVVQVVMAGDITGDGKVNIYDLREIGKAYGSKIGDPKYSPNADLTCDGKINIFDLRIIGKNYGKKDP